MIDALQEAAMGKVTPWRSLETTKPCECAHAYEAHVSMMHVSIPCIHQGCPCKAFAPAATDE